MSTEYTTEPKIPYEEFLKTNCMEILEPDKVVYSVPHKLMRKNGSYIWVFNWEGFARFERFGINNVDNVFPSIIEAFKVKIIDEYGVEYVQEEI
jgi:hypothetical protein